MQSKNVKFVMVGLVPEGLHVIIEFNDDSVYEYTISWEAFALMFGAFTNGN